MSLVCFMCSHVHIKQSHNGDQEEQREDKDRDLCCEAFVAGLFLCPGEPWRGREADILFYPRQLRRGRDAGPGARVPRVTSVTEAAVFASVAQPTVAGTRDARAPPSAAAGLLGPCCSKRALPSRARRKDDAAVLRTVICVRAAMSRLFPKLADTVAAAPVARQRVEVREVRVRDLLELGELLLDARHLKSDTDTCSGIVNCLQKGGGRDMKVGQVTTASSHQGPTYLGPSQPASKRGRLCQEADVCNMPVWGNQAEPLDGQLAARDPKGPQQACESLHEVVFNGPLERPLRKETVTVVRHQLRQALLPAKTLLPL